MTLRTLDIPQSDLLSLVRHVVHAVRNAPEAPVKSIAEATGFQERHVRYRIATARVLGLICREEDGTHVTPRGEKLLDTPPGTDNERRQLRRAVSSSAVVKQLIPDLLTRETIDLKHLRDRIAAATGLSPSTAERRAVVLRAWHRDLKDAPHGKEGTETTSENSSIF